MPANISNSTIEKRISLAIAALSILMLAATGILALLNWTAFRESLGEDYGYVLIIFGINALTTVVLSLLILTRQPGHGVGRLFLAIGFIFSWFVISYTVGGLNDFEITAIPGLIRPFIILGFGLYLLPLMMALGLVTLYFPDGRLLSPRWRLVQLIVWIGIIGQTLAQFLLDLSGDYPRLVEIVPEPAQIWLQETTSIILVLGIFASLASLVLRFFRSRGDERARMKWLVYTAVISIALTFMMVITLGDDHIVLSVFSSLIPTYLTLSIGIAILRHRLWDIDLIIRRTLQYALLTAILAGLYFGGVVLLQGILSGLSGDSDSPLITVLSTLAIAALFNPLRTRIQAFIDRRFFRSRYDAERTLEGFAAAARDEVDMGRLTGTLLGVVEETMQPESVSLWMKR